MADSHTHFNHTAAGPRNPRLESILVALEKRGPDSLPPVEICKLISFIKNAILGCALDDGSLKIKNGHIEGLPDNGFQREISAITNLARRLNFSDKFHEWVDGRLRALAYRMAREHPVEKMERIWRTMDEHGRHSYLRTIHQLQINFFSDETITFVAAEVTPKKLPDRILGTFEFDGNDLFIGSVPKISINPSELVKSTAENATGAVIHEGLHSILRQLARLRYQDRMASDHPLYQDATLMFHLVKHDSYCNAIFREAYNADPEERLAFKHEKFACTYKEQSALRRHQVERIKARPD